MTVQQQKEWTVKEAAEMFDKDPSRIRRVCIEKNLGTCYQNRIRMLKQSDIKVLSEFFEEFGRNREKMS